jgi:hypothetical protein
MPKIIGVMERLGWLYYSGWIADTKPGGVGKSKQVSFSKSMKLFTSDLGDEDRTNMMMSGQFGGDRTAIIKRVGYYASFSNPINFKMFQADAQFELMVGGTPTVFFTPDTINKTVSLSVPNHATGLTAFEPERTGSEANNKPISIATRQAFYMNIETSERFERRMRDIEQGLSLEYAQITGLLDTEVTREVQ